MLIQFVIGYNNKKLNNACMFNGASFCPEDFLHPRDVIMWLHKEISNHRECEQDRRRKAKSSIVTHSDYILKEVNILLMLGMKYASNPEATMSFLKEHGYDEYTPELFLSPNEVICTDTSGEENKNLVVGEFGFEYKIFDEVIDRMNFIQEHLMFDFEEDK